MANILDYLDWRGDLTLAERGFNEVDNLLMAELCFLDFSGIVPADFSAPVSLPEAMQKYDAARPQETMGVLVPEQIPELGHKMAASRRFSDLTLCAYVSRTDEETQTQFSALTALLPDKTAYIAFRGTDDTIVGWKEDFNLAFLPVVPAQRMAAEYLAAAAAALPDNGAPVDAFAQMQQGEKEPVAVEDRQMERKESGQQAILDEFRQFEQRYDNQSEPMPADANFMMQEDMSADELPWK